MAKKANKAKKAKSSAVKIFQVIERGSIFRSKRRLGLQAFAV